MARGRRRGGGATKVKARKKVTVKLLEREHGGKVTTPYRLMERIVKDHHPHLKDAKIAIAWRFGKKSDADGRLWLGQAKKGSDLDRSLHGFDFVILLNHEAWNGSWFTEDMMKALLDHELCHCAVANDSNGEPKVDEEGRTCYRIRKHDIEEFYEIVARHGQWKEDIRMFVAAALKDEREKKSQPLLAQAETKANGNGQAHKSNGNAAEWRSIQLDQLFDGGILKSLKKRGLTTVGGLAEYTSAGLKLTDVDGIGPDKADKIVNRLEQFWKEHPEAAAATS